MSKNQRPEYWRERFQRQKAIRDAARPPDPITEICDLDLAYLAGLVDGEGSIGITYTAIGLHLPTLCIIMSHAPVIEWAAQIIGTKVRTRYPKNDRHRTQYVVRIAGKRATVLAGRLIPFLRVKGEQAHLLVRYAETYGAHSGLNQSLSHEEYALREGLKQEMHRLNSRRGPLNRPATAREVRQDVSIKTVPQM